MCSVFPFILSKYCKVEEFLCLNIEVFGKLRVLLTKTGLVWCSNLLLISELVFYWPCCCSDPQVVCCSFPQLTFPLPAPYSWLDCSSGHLWGQLTWLAMNGMGPEKN